MLSGGRWQEEWQAKIRECVRRRVVNPDLTFVVSGLRRRGQPFDFDNLVHPVLVVFDDPIDYVRARLVVGDTPGMLFEDARSHVDDEAVLRSIYLASHSDGSARERRGIPEIVNDPVFNLHEGLGISLEFDRADIPIRRGWDGPTEAVIDDLVPWFGTYTSRDLIADHCLRDLRLVRGVNPTATGVKTKI